MAETSPPTVDVSLSRAEAIVLFELLTGFGEEDRLTMENDAERRVLCDLCCIVEQQLPELFDPAWEALVPQARATIVTHTAE